MHDDMMKLIRATITFLMNDFYISLHRVLDKLFFIQSELGLKSFGLNENRKYNIASYIKSDTESWFNTKKFTIILV